MPIEDADFKLRESSFFLARIEHEDRQHVRHEPEAFEFYLSAFMSAAYSVFDMLSGVDARTVAAWIKALKPEDQYLIKSLRGKRGASTHERKLKVETREKKVPLYKLRSGRSPFAGYHVFGPPFVPQPTAILPEYLIPFKNHRAEVVDTCRQYVALLRKLRSEFGQSPGAADRK
jgi:hypothetical protein